jgi:aryl-alcohol dehydrogenase-like predicted oxidoreductase
MHFKPLGKTGLEIAPIVFGGNVFGWTANEKTSFSLLDDFFARGFNAVDTADVYSSWVDGHDGGESETIIGKWLKQSSVKREDVVLITKVGFPSKGQKTGLSAKWITEAVDASLTRLQTDYIDLYFAHHPDEDVAIEVTLEAFDRLKQAGKIRSLGCSNYNGEQLEAALNASKANDLPRYGVIQPEYNLYNRESFEGSLEEIAIREDLGVINYFGLAAGFLTGKYRKLDDTEGTARAYRVASYVNERGLAILNTMDEVAAETGAELADIALSWLIHKPAITAPIASATSLKQLARFTSAVELKLSDAQMQKLDRAGA